MKCTVAVGNCLFFFFNDTATTEIYTLSLHDALPIYHQLHRRIVHDLLVRRDLPFVLFGDHPRGLEEQPRGRSEEHTSELQSPCNLVCRLLLEKKTRHSSSYQHEQSQTQTSSYLSRSN